MNDPRHPPSHGIPAPSPGYVPSKVVPIQSHKPTDAELDSIGLVEEADEASGDKKIQAFGIAAQQRNREWKRKANLTAAGACRVRSFHGKLSDQALGFLDDSINQWLDQHPEIEIKFVTSTIGIFEGKFREPALVLNLWY
jgi:hypothetical protein